MALQLLRLQVFEQRAEGYALAMVIGLVLGWEAQDSWEGDPGTGETEAVAGGKSARC